MFKLKQMFTSVFFALIVVFHTENFELQSKFNTALLQTCIRKKVKVLLTYKRRNRNVGKGFFNFDENKQQRVHSSLEEAGKEFKPGYSNKNWVTLRGSHHDQSLRRLRTGFFLEILGR